MVLKQPRNPNHQQRKFQEASQTKQPAVHRSENKQPHHEQSIPAGGANPPTKKYPSQGEETPEQRHEGVGRVTFRKGFMERRGGKRDGHHRCHHKIGNDCCPTDVFYWLHDPIVARRRRRMRTGQGSALVAELRINLHNHGLSPLARKLALFSFLVNVGGGARVPDPKNRLPRRPPRPSPEEIRCGVWPHEEAEMSASDSPPSTVKAWRLILEAYSTLAEEKQLDPERYRGLLRVLYLLSQQLPPMNGGDRDAQAVIDELGKRAQWVMNKGRVRKRSIYSELGIQIEWEAPYHSDTGALRVEGLIALASACKREGLEVEEVAYVLASELYDGPAYQHRKGTAELSRKIEAALYTARRIAVERVEKANDPNCPKLWVRAALRVVGANRNQIQSWFSTLHKRTAKTKG